MSILQKNKKVAAGIGVAAVAAAAIALGAGTYAAFSDTEAGPTGTVAAGTLDLVVGQTVTPSTIDFSRIKPGETITTNFTVQNAGNINGNLVADFAVSGTENGCKEPETDPANYPGGAVPPCNPSGSGDLLSALIVTVNGQAFPLAPAAQNNVPVFALNAGASQTFTIIATLPASTDNRVQSDTATIASTLRLNQAAS